MSDRFFQEVLGYYRALDEVEALVRRQEPVPENMIKRLHAMVINGAKDISPSLRRLDARQRKALALFEEQRLDCFIGYRKTFWNSAAKKRRNRSDKKILGGGHFYSLAVH